MWSGEGILAYSGSRFTIVRYRCPRGYSATLPTVAKPSLR